MGLTQLELTQIQKLTTFSVSRVNQSILREILLSAYPTRYQLIKKKGKSKNSLPTYTPIHGKTRLQFGDGTQAARPLITLKENRFFNKLTNYIRNDLPTRFAVMRRRLQLGEGWEKITENEKLFFSQNSPLINYVGQDFLPRVGDEIWQIEEIGKIRSQAANNYMGFGAIPELVAHMEGFVIVDPCRNKNPKIKSKGWLIHLSKPRQLVFLKLLKNRRISP